MMESQYADAMAAVPALAALARDEQKKLAKLACLLVEANQRLNLTRIVEPHAVALQHFADSLAVFDASPSVGMARSAADIGSGAGFPLLPLAIVLGQCQWVAIESVRKKCDFIRDAARELGLGNVLVEWGRAEDLARGPRREQFDVVTARAVGCVAGLCETGLPFLRDHGHLLLYKTVAAEEELRDSVRVIRRLGGEIRPTYHYSLPADEQQRAIFMVEKMRATPNEFPRAAGIPFKKPL